jgi:ribosome maturation factor RimP
LFDGEFRLNISENLQEEIRASVGTHDAAVVGLVCRGEARSRVFEVFVDNAQGVTLDLCREISRDLQVVLDRELPGIGYRLVVSSPGLDRPLQHPWQFGKHLGRSLDVTVTGQEGTAKGRLQSVSDTGIVLDMESGKGNRSIAFDEILSAKVRPPW